MHMQCEAERISIFLKDIEMRNKVRDTSNGKGEAADNQNYW